MRFFFTCIFLMIIGVIFGQKVDTITNQVIVQLHKAGLGKEVLNSKIQSSVCNFDVTTEGLITLKKAGISDDVISTMVNKNNEQGTVKSGSGYSSNSDSLSNNMVPGIYYCEGKPCQFQELEPSVYSQSKMGSGIMTSLTYGIAKTKNKATLGTESANLQIKEHKPIFYFHFDRNTSGNFGNNGVQNAWFSSATSPNEFLLVKFTIAKSKKTREVVTGSWNSYEGISSGIDDKYKIKFKYEKIASGIYRIYFEEPLDKGEYCFMYAGGATIYGAAPLQKVYDFGIK